MVGTDLVDMNSQIDDETRTDIVVSGPRKFEFVKPDIALVFNIDDCARFSDG